MSDHPTRPHPGHAPSAAPGSPRHPAEGATPGSCLGEEVFWRLVRGAARDTAARAQFAATLSGYDLSDQQREAFFRRFTEAAAGGEGPHPPAAPLP